VGDSAPFALVSLESPRVGLSCPVPFGVWLLSKTLGYAVSSAMRSAFAVLAAVRGTRALHPVGIDVQGVLHPLPNEVLSLGHDPVPVVGRFSKGAGLPGGLPDVLGLALHGGEGARAWDVLLSSSGEGRVGRCLPLPASSWATAWLGSIQPYADADGAHVWLAAEVTPGTVPLEGNALGSLRTRLAKASLTVALCASRADIWAPIARVELSLGDHAHRFDPVRHPLPGLRLSPRWLSQARAGAYAGSRAGAENPDGRSAPVRASAPGRSRAPARRPPRGSASPPPGRTRSSHRTGSPGRSAG
jgi:hypothetical protein